MKQIKFRQPVTRNGVFQCWHYWGYIDNNISSFTTPLSSNDGEIKESYQFTGLKDKNGKDIYEGDIISDDEENEIIGEIFFYNNGWTIKYLNSNYGGEIYDYINLTLEDDYFENDVEVFGNIYENPELLK